MTSPTDWQRPMSAADTLQSQSILQQSAEDSTPSKRFLERQKDTSQDPSLKSGEAPPSITSALSRDPSEHAKRARRRFTAANTVKLASSPTWKPGAEPGIDADKLDTSVVPQLTALRAQCDIVIVDFSPDRINTTEASNDSLEAVLSARRPHHLPCRWISVNGLSWDVIKLLAQKYSFHRLALEDLVNTRTRTKVDWYADQAFAVLTLQKLVQLHTHADDPERQCDCSQGERAMADKSQSGYPEHDLARPWRKAMLRGRKGSELPCFNDDSVSSLASEELPSHPIRTLHRYESGQNAEHTAFMEQNSALATECQVVGVEQVAIFLMADNTCISFFENSAADVEDPILERLNSKATILRRSADASLIVQAIVDAVVDLAMPVKEAYNSARKELQIDVLTNPSIKVSRALHIFSEEIDMLQNLFKPIISLVNSLRDHNSAAPIGPARSLESSEESSQGSHSSRKSDGGQAQNTRRAPTFSSVTITPISHIYLGDVLDHCLTIIQALEQMEASANNLSDLMFNTISANTNNFMMIIALGKAANFYQTYQKLTRC